MKINFIVPEIAKSGGMRIIFEYANRLTDSGHDVILYAPNIPFNSYKGMFRSYYIKYRFRYGMSNLFRKEKLPAGIFEKNFNVKFLWAFNNFTIRNADASIATTWPTAFIVNRLSKTKGNKFYFIQGYEKWNSNEDLVDASYKLPLKRITVSKCLKDLLKNKFDSESEVVLNGVDFTRFNNGNKKFNDPIQILFMDNMLDTKNTVEAIEIVKKLKTEFPEINIKCLGFSRYHEMPDFVEFIENPCEEEIIRLYRESDIFLFTSKFEGFGLPPAEAMACSCALVGNRAGAVPEFAEDKESAMLADPDKPDELYAGAKYLIENKDELKRISLAGFDSVRKTLNWNRSYNKFESILLSNTQSQ